MPQIKACVFDAYATIFDVHAPIQALADEIGPEAKDISALWRSKQLEYTWLRSLMGRYVPFSQITSDSLEFAFAAKGVDPVPFKSRLLALYDNLAAYDDAKPCLVRLKTAGARTGILSNGSPSMLSSAVNSAALDDAFDHVLSVHSVGIYKPHPSVYKLAVDTFGVDADAIGFVSANGWDCAGAAAFGFHVVHVNRFSQVPERLDAQYRVAVPNLTEAAAYLLQHIAR